MIESLFKNDVPVDVFNKAVETEMSSKDAESTPQLVKLFADKPFEAFLVDKATNLRSKDTPDQQNSLSFDLSRRLIKLLLNKVLTQDRLQFIAE